MRSYTVITALGFGPGTILGLTVAQAEPRSHALKAMGDGRYEVTSRVEFKAGEVVATDAELSKAMATALTPAAKPDAKAKK